MAMAEFSSVSVLIFLGLATLSTGEHALNQDQLPALRHLPSPLCHLRCAKDSKIKVISRKECIQSCQGKLTPSLEQSKSHDSRKRMINPVINRHFIRHQRSVDNMNVLNECQSTPQGSLQKAKNLFVNLTGERWLHIKWEAIDSSKPDFNWTSYALIYYDDDSTTDKPNCIVVPKNQTEYLLKQVDDWKFPYSFHAAVVANPYGHNVIKLETFIFRASDSGGLDSSFSSTSSATTSFGTSPNHTVRNVSIATVSGLLVALLLVLGFLKCMSLYMRRPKGSGPVPSGFDHHAFIIYSREDSAAIG